MRKLFLVCAFFIGCNVALAQGTGNTVMVPGTAAFSGPCSFIMLGNDLTDAHLYWCKGNPGTWTQLDGGGGGTPSGPNTSVQFDNSGSFGGSANLTWVSPTLTIGVDNSVAGALAIANGSAAAHTIWSSGATTTNTIAGFTVVPTTGHIVTCTVSSTTCTLTDGGAVPAGTVTVVGAGSLTSTALVTGGGSQAVQTPSATSTLDSSGNMAVAGKLTVGGTIGVVNLTCGTATTVTANYSGFMAGTSCAGGHLFTLPNSVGSAGVLHAGVDSSGISALTVSAVANSDLTNSATTPNGQTCTLGSTCNVNSGAATHSMALNEGAGAAMTGLTLGAHQTVIGAASADPNAKTVPDCQDSAGNHLNFTQSTDAFSCGTSSSGGGGLSYAAAGGSANAQTAAPSPALANQNAGVAFLFLPVAANTTSNPNLNVSTLGAQTITKCGTAALLAGDLSTTADALVISDGTHWQLQNPQIAGCGLNPTSFSNGTITTSLTVTPANGLYQTTTLTAADAATISFTQPTAGVVTITLVVTQASTPTGTITWSGVKWPGGVAPVMTASASAIDIYTFKLDGSNVYGTAAQNMQ